MHHRCPKCHRKITRIADGCRFCGWSFDQDLGQPAAEATIPMDAPPLVGESIDEHLDQALDAIEREEFAAALKSINRALVDAESARLGECYSLRGFVQLQLQHFDRAEEDCSRSIRHRGPEAETLSWRAAARGELGKWRMAFDDLVAARQIADWDRDTYDEQIQSYAQPALAWFSQQVKLGDDRDELFFDRGWIYWILGNAEKARRDFELALTRNPEHGPSLVGQALLHLDAGRFDEAIQLSGRALQLAEDFRAPALRCRALAHWRQDRPALAAEDVNQMRELIGDSAEGLVQCARVRTELGDLAGAIEEITLAGKINPHMTGLLRMRGDLYAQMCNYHLAAGDFSAYLQSNPGDDQVLLRRAEMYVKQQQLDAALTDFETAISLNEINALAYLGRCRVLHKKLQLDEALEQSERALRLDSRLAAVHQTRGQIYLDKERNDLAEDEFTRAIHLADTDIQRAEFCYLRGAARYALGHLHDAVADFAEAAKLRPKHAGTLIWRAAAAARLEDWRDVIENLQRAIALRPNAARQYRSLARPVAQRAIDYFNRQIQSGQSEAGLYRLRGMAYQFLGDPEQAIADYATALEQNPSDSDLKVRRAQMCAHQGQHKAAAKQLSEVLEDDPQNARARFFRAVSLIELGRFDKAMRDLDRAIATAPGEPRYYVLYADLLVRDNKYSQAITLLGRAIAGDPADHVARRKRGACFLRCNQLLQAIADLTRSIELYPAQPETITLRGQAYLRNGQAQLANEDFERALTLDATLSKAYAGRAQVLAHNRQHESALIWLTKAIHRFNEPRELAELLMARGKVYYQMGRFVPAISDFSTVMQLQREDSRAVATARCARAVALVQHGDLVKAQTEFQKVLGEIPQHSGAQEASRWLQNGSGARPPILQPPEQMVRPTRPPVCAKPKQWDPADRQWDSPPPYDLWIVRTKTRREYGPIPKATLDQWVREGRIDRRTRLLKSGWPKWRKAAAVYPQLEKV